MGRRTGFVPASGPDVRTCECGTKFLFAFSERGRAIAVEAQVNFTGEVILCFEVDQDGRPTSEQLVVAAPKGYDGPRWVDHRLTCTKASYHQRRSALRGEL
jgi:hypothetical protein